MLLLVTDTHLGLYKSSDVWHDVTINLFKEIADTALRSGIDTLLHLGDFFDERKATNNKTIDVAYEIEEILSVFKQVYIITGNHDIYYKNVLKPSSLQIFKNSKNIQVITEPYVIENDHLLLPWGSPIPEYHSYKYCFGHFDINGCYMNNKKICDKGRYNIKDFEGFKHTYSGHFHTPSTYRNIIYLGSPFQQTFHDVGSTRGYYTFSDSKLELIPFEEYPKFTILRTSDTIKEEQIRGNIVKLVFDDDYGTNKNIELVERVQAFEPLKFSTDFTKVANKDDNANMEEVDESLLNQGHKSIMEEWIDKDKRKVSINKNKAKEILGNMLEEIEE